MDKVGLITSDTGKPGGKRVAQQMSHYINPDGEFIRIIRPFLAEGYRARWADRFTGALRDEWEPDHPPLTPGGISLVDSDIESEPVDGQLDTEGSLSAPGRPAAALAAMPASAMASNLSADADDQPADMNALMSSLPQDEDAGEADAIATPVHKPMEEPLASRVQGVFVHGRHGRTKGATRHKYGCPQCSVAVWGKPSLNIKCGNCDLALEDQG